MGLLAGVAALSGIYVNSHYRKQMHLRNLARISTYIPIVALPGIMSALFHNQV
jgi:transmembrane protein 126A